MHEIMLNNDEASSGRSRRTSANIGWELQRRQESGDKCFSVELCSNMATDVAELERLDALGALFYSVTWINRDEGAAAINACAKDNAALSVASALAGSGRRALLHLPARYLREDTARDVLGAARAKGLRHVFALQGETLPLTELQPAPERFRHAVDLVGFIHEHFGDTFETAVTGYPKGHHRSPSAEQDLAHLKQKVDAGAAFVITQMFFETDVFRAFYRSCRRLGVTVPIVPGVAVLDSLEGLLRVAKLCKIAPPQSLLAAFRSAGSNEAATRNLAVHHAVQLIKQLLLDAECPVADVHFFSLNKLGTVSDICRQLGFCAARVDRPVHDADVARTDRDHLPGPPAVAQ